MTESSTSTSTSNDIINDQDEKQIDTSIPEAQLNIPTKDEKKMGKLPYFGMTGKKLNVWVTVACTTAMTLFGTLSAHSRTYRSELLKLHAIHLGYDQGVFGGIIVTEDFLKTMGNPDPELQGTIVSLYDIGW